MSDKQLWIWRWSGGGYNSCLAADRETAISIAKAMHPACLIDEPTLHVGTTEELMKLDRQFFND